MSNFIQQRFKEANYIPATGILNEQRLFSVVHICIHEDCTLYNDLVLPYGARDIEEKSTLVIDEILHEIVHLIQDKDNLNKRIIVCGTDKARRMLGRKLEDRLKREVEYK